MLINNTMTLEQKKLVVREICARMPYGVIMTNIKLPETHYPLTCNDLHDAMFDDDWDDVPYLRPMSSMTEEEKDFIRNKYFYEDWDSWNDLLHYHYHLINVEEIPEFMEWIYTHHFDFPRAQEDGSYKTLTQLGLAIEDKDNSAYKNYKQW